MAGESKYDQCAKECSGCKTCMEFDYSGGSMRDWQDRETEEENEIDTILKPILTEDLIKALKRRQESEIRDKLKKYEAELRKQTKKLD